jgi:hypothetical protein
MTAALASPIAPPERSRRPTPTRIAGNGPSATSWEASSVPAFVEYTLDVAPPVAAPLVEDDLMPVLNPMAEFAKFILTQWMAAFVTYEALAATIDRRGRYLPTLGI